MILKTAPVTTLTLAFTSAIIVSSVVSIPVADDTNHNKNFASSDAREKRSGWGYYYENHERPSTFVPSPIDHFRSPSAPATATTFYPAQPYNYYNYKYNAAAGGQSYVWQSTPNYQYSINQIHPGWNYRTYNTQKAYPGGWSSWS